MDAMGGGPLLFILFREQRSEARSREGSPPDFRRTDHKGRTGSAEVAAPFIVA
jgi:hypothetical protein